MKISVIIVSAGVKNYIHTCLTSIFLQTYLPDEVIVIDNSLQPKFSQEINALYPSVKLYSANENLFYAAALNKGIALSQGEFVLCQNDDLVLDKAFIQEALQGFQLDQRIGSVSGKLLRSGGTILDSTGLFLSLWRSAKERGYGRPDRGQFDQPGFIFGVSGAAAFYRRKMLEALRLPEGYFDSSFRMFYEDLDLAWRAQRSGWRAYYVPTALAYHTRGGSFRPDSGIDKPLGRKYLNDQLHCDLIKNRYRTLLRNETWLDFLLHLIPILIYDLCAWVYIILFRPRMFKLCFKHIFRQSGTE